LVYWKEEKKTKTISLNNSKQISLRWKNKINNFLVKILCWRKEIKYNKRSRLLAATGAAAELVFE